MQLSVGNFLCFQGMKFHHTQGSEASIKSILKIKRKSQRVFFYFANHQNDLRKTVVTFKRKEEESES
jgi:hypothetical protein